jgi:hypothetical protein
MTCLRHSSSLCSRFSLPEFFAEIFRFSLVAQRRRLPLVERIANARAQQGLHSLACARSDCDSLQKVVVHG